jgi:hypothetical protein
MAPHSDNRDTGIDRRSLLRGGVLLGAAAGLAAASTAFASSAEASTPEPQGDWRWCSACTALFYGGTQELSSILYCFETAGPHVVGTTQYSLYSGEPSAISGYSYQANWNYCTACKLLYYGPQRSNSGCPTASFYNGNSYDEILPHTAGSTSYDVFTAAPSGLSAQTGWNFCTKCHGLFHGSGQSTKGCVYWPYTHTPYNSTYWVGT